MGLFSASSTIIYLTNQKAFYQKNKQKGSLDFDRQDFDNFFKQLKETTKASSFKIILGNDIGYLLTLTTKKTTKPDEILAQASELIPEEMTPTNSVITLHNQEGTDNNTAQVFVVPSYLLDAITQASTKHDIEIEYLCPILSVINFSLEEKIKPILYLYLAEEESVAAVIKQGVIYGSQNTSQGQTDKIEELTDYVKEHFGFKPEVIYTNTDTKDLSLNSNLEIKKSSLDPYAFVESHQVTEKAVSNFITLKPVHKREKEVTPSPNDQPAAEQVEAKSANTEITPDNVDIQEKKSPSSIILSIVLVLIIVGALGFFIYQYFVLNLKK